MDSVKIDNFSVDGSKTIYVANNGTDRNDGLTPEKPKRNIEIALDAANPGDTIRLAPGTYKKNIQINKNLTLTGDNQNNTIIDGQQQNCCIHINAEGVTVTIANLTITGGKNKVYNYRNFGGGLRNDGILKLENSTIIDNNIIGWGWNL